MSGVWYSGSAPIAEYNAVTEARDKALATIAALEERIEELEAVQFTPTGDNHHNALKCPYCNPEQIDPVAERKRREEAEGLLNRWRNGQSVNGQVDAYFARYQEKEQ